jgi:hypothetical protein
MAAMLMRHSRRMHFAAARTPPAVCISSKTGSLPAHRHVMMFMCWQVGGPHECGTISVPFIAPPAHTVALLCCRSVLHTARYISAAAPAQPRTSPGCTRACCSPCAVLCSAQPLHGLHAGHHSRYGWLPVSPNSVWLTRWASGWLTFTDHHA